MPCVCAFVCVFIGDSGEGGKRHTHTCVSILSSEEVGSHLQGFGLHLGSRFNRMVTLIHKMNMCLVSTILHNYVCPTNMDLMSSME